MTSPDAMRQLSLGDSALARDNFRSAEAFFREAIRLDPGYAVGHLRLALALSSLNRIEEGVLEATRSLELDPDQAPAYQLISGLNQRLGNFPEAIKAARTLIELDPNLVRPYTDIVRSKKVTNDDLPLIARMETLVLEPGRSQGERIGLHFSLGKAYDDLKEFEAAIRHFDAGNEMAAKHLGPLLNYDPQLEGIAAEKLIGHFDASFFRRHESAGSASELPLLVIGMIRSGTTLLDTILSSHPKISTAGELTFWEQEALPLLRMSYKGEIPAPMLQATEDRYRILLRSHGITSKRVIDKMPMNYQYVGLVHAAFPKARFIHIKRHPVDTCVSIYGTHFDVPPKFAYIRSNIIAAYRQYLAYMAHWRSVIPADRFIEVNYEDIVNDKNAVLTQLMEFIGLPWDDDLLHHEQNRTDISTPSIWQARQPIYRSSMERWRNYEPWLGEFASLLPASGLS